MPEFLLTIIRSVIAFMLLMVMTRIMGKKQLSQLTFFDYCVGITIGSIASALAIDQNIKISNGIVGLIILGVFPVLLAYGGLKSIKFRKITDGTPSILIENGKVLERNLFKSKVAIDELMLFLREKNIFKVTDVEMAILETNGQLSVMKKSDQQPLTPKQLGLTVNAEHGPAIVIMDGKLMDKSLSSLGYSKEWLLGEIGKQGASTYEDVFLAQIDSNGNVFVDLYNDNLQQHKVKQKPLLAASLKKVQADLESFSQQTNNPEAKKMYSQQAANLQTTIESILPYLK
ncbi:DUF421 domain-containing protein [Virgibacillus phasianinus]|uniref:DUF421 domain-containing protein n=1 Tax=Virgibacillus phasianinus TaxID=2017483 RepID=A0A220U657_9BACI|nr:DUF421 domain-containing protein [Virgibacillus phasianinus]ASK63535.1 DUF421 domain-containing protein [Virgibacillus phasianinus]